MGFLRHDHRIHQKEDATAKRLHPVTNSVRLVIPGGLLPSRARFRFTRQENVNSIDLQCQVNKLNKKRVLSVRGHLALM